MVKAFQEIGPGVFWIEQSTLDGKNGVVIGDRAALAIDSGSTMADGEAVADLIRARGRAPARLVLTHGHGDHILGSGAFRGAEVFAHARTPAVMRRHLPQLALHYGRTDLETELMWPTVTFTGALTIMLGGKTVHLVSASGHSEDGTYAYVVEHRILFSGDTAVTAITPVISDGHSRLLEASLRRMSEIGAETLVPGHGPVIHGRHAVQRHLLWGADYLSRVRVEVRNLLTLGASPVAVVAACGYDRFVGDQPVGPHQRSEKPHQLTVAKVVREVQEELGSPLMPQPDNER